MRITRIFVFAAATLVATVSARAGEAGDQRSAKEKKEQKEKKGALAEKPDPAKDIALQKQNVKRLRHNAEQSRKNGNRVAAWAAEHDAKHAEKLIAKDEKLLREGREKKSVDGEDVKKGEETKKDNDAKKAVDAKSDDAKDARK
jgi:hypothetical protein